MSRQGHPRYTDARKGRPWVAHNTTRSATNARNQKTDTTVFNKNTECSALELIVTELHTIGLICWFLVARVCIALVKYHTSNDVFSRCKSVHKMATGKSDDQLIQPDNMLELGTSYKMKVEPKVEN